MITFHFWSIQSITITIAQKTVIDCNRLRLTIMTTPCLFVAFKMFSIPNYRPKDSLGESRVPAWTHSESRRRWAM